MRRYILFIKRFFCLKYSKSDFDYISVSYLRQLKLFKTIKIIDNFIEVETMRGQRLYSRVYPSGDMAIFKQIWVDGEYKPLINLLKDNIFQRNEIRIIDAGANVGFASSYFLSYFTDCKIACIEPDTNNLSILKKNLAAYITNNNIIIYENGLMDIDNIYLSTNRDFRDGNDYAISVTAASKNTTLKSISISTIMKDNRWDEVDILKIDIEGAERFVFHDKADISFLKCVKIISIEIHDEYQIREMIYEKLHSLGFILFNSKETTHGINLRYVPNKI